MFFQTQSFELFKALHLKKHAKSTIVEMKNTEHLVVNSRW